MNIQPPDRSIADAASRLCDRWPNLRVTHFATTKSTNDDAKSSLPTDRGQSPVHLFVADRQTSGRGRGGKTFDSDDGTLTFTLRLFAPENDAVQSLWLAVARGVADGLRAARNSFDANHPNASNHLNASGGDSSVRHPMDETIEIKPPNDILLGGKKIAGILIETVPNRRGRYYIIGVGVNVSSIPSLSDSRSPEAPPVGCLFENVDDNVDEWGDSARGDLRGVVLESIVESLIDRIGIPVAPDSI